MMSATATIHELRTDFRAVKRKIEQHGEVIITDNGEPAYVVRHVVPEPKEVKPMPDYFARVRRRQPQALSETETRSFHLENRGEALINTPAVASDSGKGEGAALDLVSG